MRTIKSNLPIDEAIYNEGFESGVKSATLTWEDVQTIDNIIVDMAQHTDWPLKGKEAFYEEVLKRFIEKREKK
jgi:hypothetical protein